MTKPPTTQILCGTCGQEVTATEVSCSRCGQHLTRGIGGWLLFFILTLVVFGPVARLANFRTHNAHSLELFAQSARPHLLYVLYVIEQVLAFTVSGYGV